MERITRDTLWYFVWSALSFPGKMDKRELEKLMVIDGPGAMDRLVERVCNHIDSDRFAVIDAGDNYMCARDPLPERGDLVELRSLGPSVPPPVVKAS